MRTNERASLVFNCCVVGHRLTTKQPCSAATQTQAADGAGTYLSPGAIVRRNTHMVHRSGDRLVVMSDARLTFERYELDPHHTAVWELLDDASTVTELAERSPLPATRTLKILAQLHAWWLVRLDMPTAS